MPARMRSADVLRADNNASRKEMRGKLQQREGRSWSDGPPRRRDFGARPGKTSFRLHAVAEMLLASATETYFVTLGTSLSFIFIYLSQMRYSLLLHFKM